LSDAISFDGFSLVTQYKRELAGLDVEFEELHSRDPYVSFSAPQVYCGNCR
jgi:hypothetical protein